MEKLDIPKIYSEIHSAITIDEHDKIIQLCDKVLKASSIKEQKEAFHCKIVALINLGKNEEVIQLLEKDNSNKNYIIEYSYALYDNSQYSDSLSFLNKNGSNDESSKMLNAQNHYKLENFKESYNVYKEFIQSKIKSKETLNDDLITNCLASYTMGEINDDIGYLIKYLNSWESFYNYCVISLKQKKFTECLETLSQMKTFGPIEEELNEHKLNFLIFTLVQVGLDGFDLAKCTNLCESLQTQIQKTQNKGGISELTPYYYNTFISIKKESENLHEAIRKLDNFLRNDKKLSQAEKELLILNKITLLLRANKINEANDIFSKINPNPNDIRHYLIRSYIAYKGENKLEEFLNKNPRRPESDLILLQVELSHLTQKNTEQFHNRIMKYVTNNYDNCVNYHFQRFFINFYESRHLKNFEIEYIQKFSDPKLFKNDKKALNLLGNALCHCGFYKEGGSMFNYIIKNIDSNDKETKLNLINWVSHYDIRQSSDIRMEIDDTKVDLTHENISNLLTEVVLRFKRNVTANKTNKKKKKKKPIRLPKNFDPKHPAPMPDAERWMPRLQRKKYKGLNKNKKAYQGGDTTDNRAGTTNTGATFSHFAEKR